MDTTDCLVVGTGVIGLAVARELAASGREVVVLEAAGGIGSGTSSRNSEVIHAGIYYAAGSLMARLCVAGRALLYEFCRSRHVPHHRIGKLIVATSAEEAERLAAIKARAAANGVDDLELIDARRAHALEPELSATAALISPSTGIIDSHAYMLALRGEAESHGAAFAFHAAMLSAEAVQGGFVVTAGGAAPMRLRCRTLVNAAGLHAPALARAIAGLDERHVPQPYFAKGNYFACTARAPFSRLIYPVPVPGGLGVHLTLDLGGQAKFGPDVEWLNAASADDLDYAVDPGRAAQFYPAIRRYWPGLPDGALAPAYAGVRPKIVPPAVATQDFRIDGPDVHGLEGLVNLFGIESPGLTASLAIARHVAALAAA
ncbi:MAG: NAD(P)/FAD-dependent oxidoreductase [Xanthobacteraceae bacterium]|nr:MAG: NAD(P)/FAD-dependent oxidoreductase [Xanthobacteraceae bacterium]